ncbi:MAG: 50S ribosomal protein L24 [archaeon]|jgi:large subunit ribosomal protein L24|nr:50S ribosomal protein L24 [Euryarchaeota archaeon]MDP7260789.1 50S ribosomal protein L24 [archaeon]|tara:strand:+ start:28434 stop:28940 length:507 start_codon:yes stop_codon:yes gene_type:complete
MKANWSTSWLSSKQPRKQRKYLYNAPMHARQRLISSHLDKKLREKLGTRSISVRKGDEVKIMRGSLKGLKGKILEVNLETGRVQIEGQTRDKVAGGKAAITFLPSNLLVTSLNTSDKLRFKRVAKSKRPELKAVSPKKSPKKEGSNTEKKDEKPEVKSDSKSSKEEKK